MCTAHCAHNRNNNHHKRTTMNLASQTPDLGSSWRRWPVDGRGPHGESVFKAKLSRWVREFCFSRAKGFRISPESQPLSRGFRVESVFCHLYFCDHKNTYFFDTFFFIWKVILVVSKSHHTCSARHPACSMLYVITEEQLWWKVKSG